MFDYIVTFGTLRRETADARFRIPPDAIPADESENPEKGEYVDLRDFRGEPTGYKVPRKSAHAEGYPHGGVTIIPFNLRTGEILLHDRSDDKDVFPGRTDVIGGHPKAAMSWEEARDAESTEELFYIDPWRFIPVGPQDFKFFADTRHPAIGHNIEFKKVCLVGLWDDEIQGLEERNRDLTTFWSSTADERKQKLEEQAKKLYEEKNADLVPYESLSETDKKQWLKEAAGFWEIKSYRWANWTPIDGALARYRRSPEEFADGFYSLFGNRRYRRMIASAIQAERIRQGIIEQMGDETLPPSQGYSRVAKELLYAGRIGSVIRLLLLWKWRRTTDLPSVDQAMARLAGSSPSEQRLLAVAFRREPERRDLYAVQKLKGSKFPYTEKSLATVRREHPPIPMKSLISRIPNQAEGARVRNEVDLFVERLRGSKAAQNGKVIFNRDVAASFAYQVTWLRSDAVDGLGENAETQIHQEMLRTPAATIQFSEGASISWVNGKVSIFGLDVGSALIKFRTRVLGRTQARRIVHLPVATVVVPLDPGEELDEWRRIVKEFEAHDFGSATLDSAELVHHTDDFLTDAQPVATYPLTAATGPADGSGTRPAPNNSSGKSKFGLFLLIAGLGLMNLHFAGPAGGWAHLSGLAAAMIGGAWIIFQRRQDPWKFSAPRKPFEGRVHGAA
jgi:hypothetical protein